MTQYGPHMIVSVLEDTLLRAERIIDTLVKQAPTYRPDNQMKLDMEAFVDCVELIKIARGLPS